MSLLHSLFISFRCVQFCLCKCNTAVFHKLTKVNISIKLVQKMKTYSAFLCFNYGSIYKILLAYLLTFFVVFLNLL